MAETVDMTAPDCELLLGTKNTGQRNSGVFGWRVLYQEYWTYFVETQANLPGRFNRRCFQVIFWSNIMDRFRCSWPVTLVLSQVKNFVFLNQLRRIISIDLTDLDAGWRCQIISWLKKSICMTLTHLHDPDGGWQGQTFRRSKGKFVPSQFRCHDVQD